MWGGGGDGRRRSAPHRAGGSGSVNGRRRPTWRWQPWWGGGGAGVACLCRKDALRHLQAEGRELPPAARAVAHQRLSVRGSLVRSCGMAVVRQLRVSVNFKFAASRARHQHQSSTPILSHLSGVQRFRSFPLLMVWRARLGVICRCYSLRLALDGRPRPDLQSLPGRVHIDQQGRHHHRRRRAARAARRAHL